MKVIKYALTHFSGTKMAKKPSMMASLKRDLEKAEKIPILKKGESELHPMRGERGDFLKLTITMPPELVLRLKQHGAERRIMGEKNCDTSSLIRSAVKKYLDEYK